MGKNSARQVRILRDITYHPQGNLGWYRKFRAGWEGPVTEQQYKFLLAEKAGEPAIPASEVTVPGGNTAAGTDGAAL